MQVEYKGFQTYLRQTFPEYSEMTAYEIYQLKKQDLNFINSASKYLHYHGDLLRLIIFFDYYEFIDNNNSPLLDFMEIFCPIGYSGCFNSVDKTVISVNYEGHLPYKENLRGIKNEFNDCLTAFIINKKDDSIQIFQNDLLFEYNKLNLNKLYLHALQKVKEQVSHPNIVFNYLYSFLNKFTDLFDFYVTSSTYSIDHHIIRFEEITPPIEVKKYNKAFLLFSQNNSFIEIISNNKKSFLDINLQFISKDNFLTNLVDPLKQIIINFDESQSNSYTQKWINYIQSQFSVILSEQNFDNIFQIKINNKNCYSSFLNKDMYSGVVNAKIYCKQLNKEVEILSDLKLWDDEQKIIYLYELYKTFKDNEQLNSILNGSIKTKKRI